MKQSKFCLNLSLGFFLLIASAQGYADTDIITNLTLYGRVVNDPMPTGTYYFKPEKVQTVSFTYFSSDTGGTVNVAAPPLLGLFSTQMLIKVPVSNPLAYFNYGNKSYTWPGSYNMANSIINPNWANGTGLIVGAIYRYQSGAFNKLADCTLSRDNLAVYHLTRGNPYALKLTMDLKDGTWATCTAFLDTGAK